MTRKQLKELGLGPEQIEQVITLHAEGMAPIRKEADTLREENAAFRAQQEANADLQTQLSAMMAERDDCLSRLQRQEAMQRQHACERLLREGGANAEAIPLLMKALDPAAVQLTEDGAIREAEALLAPLKEQYGSFFARERLIGFPDLTPPVQGSPLLTHEEVCAMDDEDINRNWDTVRAALRGW